MVGAGADEVDLGAEGGGPPVEFAIDGLHHALDLGDDSGSQGVHLVLDDGRGLAEDLGRSCSLVSEKRPMASSQVKTDSGSSSSSASADWT